MAAHEDVAAAAVAVVESFFECVGRRDLEGAQRYLAREVCLIFPPGQRFASLAEMVAAAAGRYQWVDKRRDDYDAFSRGADEVVVISMGRLFGANRHGVRFDNVRYVDRFVLRDERIVEQRVWNDLAHTGVLEATATDQIGAPWRAAEHGSGGAGPRRR